jgi:hypothetical protein
MGENLARDCGRIVVVQINELQITGDRMTTTATPIDDAIRAAAIAKGYSDASVVTQKVQDRPGALDVGNWAVLSIKRTAGDDWELLGRRRTADELLAMLKV